MKIVQDNAFLSLGVPNRVVLYNLDITESINTKNPTDYYNHLANIFNDKQIISFSLTKIDGFITLRLKCAR